MNITAFLENDQEYHWGWKSSIDHWNDDAVWAFPDYNWFELYEPGTGSGFPYTLGDVDNDGDIDDDDVTALTNWIFAGIPPASWTPDGMLYPAGDVDGDCMNTAVDIAILSSFVATGGPPLVPCPQYPPGEPAISLDLSFVITGTATCDCFPGDANNDGGINLGDAGYIVNWIFYDGPAPCQVCSGDANCDCSVNLGDAGYIINWIFFDGPVPCDRDTWLSICGQPLRK